MKKLLFILLVFIIGITFVLQDKKPNSEATQAVLLMDAETGKVIYEENSKKTVPIASLTKLMTQYLVLDALKADALTWESTYEPTDHVLQLSGSKSIVQLHMTPGFSYTLKELFTAMTVISANDAAIALAEMVGGTESDFVHLMNNKANEFGLKDTIFFNASGLDGDYIGQGKERTNRSSAKDVSLIAQRLLANHPEVLDFTRMPNFKTKEGDIRWSTNLMLAGMPQAMEGMDGLKTGFTDEAGGCFASTGMFDGRRIITIVLGVAAEGKDTTNPRFELTQQLINRYVLK